MNAYADPPGVETEPLLCPECDAWVVHMKAESATATAFLCLRCDGVEVWRKGDDGWTITRRQSKPNRETP